MTGILYVVATPIGNLGDFTKRAQEVLASVDLIAAEDTRHSQRLLDAFSIKTSMTSLHEHNESKKVDYLIGLLLEGRNIAVISDAGTPLISDPGYRLVEQAHYHKITLVPLPGANAAICALSVAGLATDRFIFEGFLPAKASARETRLKTLLQETRTLVFYESPHRLIACLQTMITVFGENRLLVIANELTKRYEAIVRLPLGEAVDWIQQSPDRKKGEFVLLLAGSPELVKNTDNQQLTKMLQVLLKQMGLRQAVDCVVEITGISKNEVYQLGLALKNNKPQQ